MLKYFLSGRWGKTVFPFALTILFVVVISGCGKNDGLTSINGTVFFDDSPLDNGSIVFIPADGSGTMSDAKIQSGKFKARVQPQKRLAVKIYSMKDVPVDSKTASPLTPSGNAVETQTVCIIPECYNEKTTLAIEPAAGDKTFRFDLQSDPSKSLSSH